MLLNKDPKVLDEVLGVNQKRERVQCIYFDTDEDKVAHSWDTLIALIGKKLHRKPELVEDFATNVGTYYDIFDICGMIKGICDWLERPPRK